MRFIAFILAAALCLAPASAADVYRVQSDTNVLTMSAYDVVATAEWTDNQISQVLTYLSNIYNHLGSIKSSTTDIEIDAHDISETLTNFYNRFGYVSGSSLAADFDVLLDNFGFSGWSQSLRELLTGNTRYSYSLMDFLNLAYLSDQRMETAYDNWLISWDSFSSAVSAFDPDILVGSGTIMGRFGLPEVVSSIYLGDFLRRFSSGMSYHLTLSEGLPYVSWSGSIADLESSQRFSVLFSSAMVGLARNIQAISTGSYTMFPFMSDSGEEAYFSARTMGEMLYTLLARMQIDLGHLGYIYADEETVQAKKDAAENEKAATDGFLKPGGPGSLSVSDITSAAGAVGSAKDMLSTGVTPGQAFEQLQGSGPLEFFTSVTASNLNTVPAAVSDLEDDDFVHFYDPSNSEFFELIGKGSG